MAATDNIDEIPNVCNPRYAITAEDPDDYYVDCGEVRQGGSLKSVERLIRASETTTHQLITGHSGCGKTTEIVRLKESLEQEKKGKKLKVFYMDALSRLDLSNVDFSDILLAIADFFENLEDDIKPSAFGSWKSMVDDIHLILTIPLSLCHLSSSASRLGSLYDFEPVVIPMIKVWNREEKKEFKQGINTLKTILGKRVVIDKVFDDVTTVEEACRLSGGAIRDLLRIIRGASLYCDELPIKKEQIKTASKEIIRSYNRVIGQYIGILKYVDKHKQFPLDMDTDRKKTSLHELYVLEYCNGDQWYDVHPLIKKTGLYEQAAESEI